MITLFVQGKKGLDVVSNIKESQNYLIEKVIIGFDNKILKDYSIEIAEVCESLSLEYITTKAIKSFTTRYAFAIGWQFLIEYRDNQDLIVFHDSLLPRLRGFNPLVTALINGDREIGVTALFASKRYDEGEIIFQDKTTIDFPITISEAIDRISDCYVSLFNQLITVIKGGNNLVCTKQNDNEVTYSLWRNNDDYFIDWTHSADSIERFVDAVGFPYLGAKARFEDKVVTIVKVKALPDVVIENREVGKVIFKENDSLVIVAGSGLIKIIEIKDTNNNSISFKNKFRIKFS